MPSITIPQHDFGHPKNEDYAYDLARQRKVDMDDVKLCKNCRHFRNSSCHSQMNLRPDYVNGGVSTKNSPDFLRSDRERCGHDGVWWEAALVKVAL